MAKRNINYGNAQRLTYEAHSKKPSRVIVARQRVPLYVIVIALIIVAAGMVGAGFLGAKLATDKLAVKQDKTTVIINDSRGKGSPMTSVGEKMSIPGVYNAVSPAIVKITTGNQRNENQGNIELYPGAGSGIVIGSNGEILTSYHVVAGATDIKVTLKNGMTYEVNEFKGDIITDTAILKIDTDTSNIQATVSSNFALNMAEEVVMVAYPRTSKEQVVSSGILSGQREIVTVNNVDLELERTTAPVNPGNSGGGIFNMYGVLVGMVNSRRSGDSSANVAYFSRADKCVDIATQLIENNYVKDRVDTKTVEFSEVKNSSAMRPWVGLYVTKDNSGSGQFIPGDYIKSVAGKSVLERQDWEKALSESVVGSTVVVKFVRNNNEHTAHLQLTQKRYCDN